MKSLISNTFYLFGNLISKLLNLYCYVRNISIVVIREDRYGHQIGTLDCELFLARQRKNEFNRDTVFLLIEKIDNLANQYLRQITPEIVKKFGFSCHVIKSRSRLTIFYLFLKNYISENKRFYRSSKTLSPHLKKSLFDIHNTSEEILNKLKIQKEKYICIYARDSRYLNERFPNLDWTYHNHRNTDIDNLSSLASFITSELNLEVVRVGSNVNKAISWSKETFPKIIDYSFSDYVSEKNDIDLIASCSMYISNGGGPETVAIAARRKMIRINQTPILEEVGYDFGIYLPMLIKRKFDESIISISEAVNLGISKTYNYNDYREINLYPEENCQIDILNAFRDYIKFKNNNFSSLERSSIEEYKKIRKINENKGLIIRGFNNFIAPSFLIKYPELLN